MKNIIFIILFFSKSIYAQKGFSVEATPNVVFADYKGGGVIPTGFFLKKYNLSFSGGASIFHTFNKYITVRFGYHYFINNYRSVYFVDSESTKLPFNRNSIQVSFFEPKISFNYNFYLKNRQLLFLEMGIGVSISRSPGYKINTEYVYTNVYGLVDTILSSTTVSPLKNSSPLKYYFSIGKTFSILKKKTEYLNLDILLSYRYSQNEELIIRTFIDKGHYYNFYYYRNSSYVGLTFRLNYDVTKRKKAHEDG